MNGETFNDGAMLEIFRAEVETHVEALTAGLLALERDPGDTTHVDSMMRGAHSIKGASRIVGIDPAVHVAHVMEDVFIAAQNDKLRLNPDHVDVLLRGVDILSRMAAASKENTVNWKQFDIEAQPLVAQIHSILTGAAPDAAKAPPTIHVTSPESAATSGAITACTTPEQATRSSNMLSLAAVGLLDATTAESLRRDLIIGLDHGIGQIQLDLSQTSDLDAIGLAFLAAIPPFVQKSGGTLKLVGASGELQEVLRVTGVLKLYQTGGS